MQVRMREPKGRTSHEPEHLAGSGWFAAVPNNSLITARDTRSEEIYALDSGSVMSLEIR
jgi:hypothetical protein